jgi:hypothetical protein
MRLLILMTLLIGWTAKAQVDCEGSLAGRDLAARFTAEYFVKKLALPNLEEIQKKTNLPELELSDADIKSYVLSFVSSDTALFQPLRKKAAEKAMAFFAARLRLPTSDELASLLGFSETEILEAIKGSDFAAFAKREAPEALLKANKTLVNAYLRALNKRDVPRYLKTVPTRPTMAELYQALIMLKSGSKLHADAMTGLFSVETLQSLLEENEMSLFPGGILELEKEARILKPGSFANFTSPDVMNIEKSRRLKAALEAKAGFLVTSVTAGIPLEDDMLTLMLLYAETRNYDIVIFLTNNQTEGLDPRLIDHPRIHLVSHTISNRFFKLNNMGLMPKNQNPFASLDKAKQFLPGQLTIVGHPQLMHKIVPTSSNHVRDTQLWSTGSLSKNLYPYMYPAQARTSAIAKNSHTNSFLVLEKTDAKAGIDGSGTQNRWHVRPVEFANDPKDTHAGFTDLGQHYFMGSDGSPQVDRQNPQGLFMGDIHEILADQRFLKAYREFLLGFEEHSISVFVEDPIDNMSSNHHEFDRLGLLMKRFVSGELDISKELTGLVQFDNALAAIPSVRNRNYKDSNHSYWLKYLLDKKPNSHLIMNGKILAELTLARDVLKITEPLEYILNYRKQFVASLPPDVRRDYEEKEVFVQDTQNVRVLPYGEPLVLGPAWRPMHADKHGHQGDNGAKPSPRSHAAGQERAITGDSHRSAILGGWVNIGTSTPKRVGYNNGGYSSWTNSTAVTYPDGTIQLLSYDSVVGTLFARPDQRVMPAEDFFGDDPLEISENDNDLLPKTEVYDQFSEWGRRFRNRLGSD